MQTTCVRGYESSSDGTDLTSTNTPFSLLGALLRLVISSKSPCLLSTSRYSLTSPTSYDLGLAFFWNHLPPPWTYLILEDAVAAPVDVVWAW